MNKTLPVWHWPEFVMMMKLLLFSAFYLAGLLFAAIVAMSVPAPWRAFAVHTSLVLWLCLAVALVVRARFRRANHAER